MALYPIILYAGQTWIVSGGPTSGLVNWPQCPIDGWSMLVVQVDSKWTKGAYFIEGFAST